MSKIGILVLGKSGQVARELARASWPQGRRAVCVGREAFDLVSADAGALADLYQRENAQIVINAAGYTAVDQAEEEEATAFALNAEAPARMAEACALHAIPLIHLSTDYVFDGKKNTPYVEADPVNPLCVYGKSKAAGEAAVRERLPQHIILRTAWVFSPFGHNFVKTMLHLGAERDELHVVDDQRSSPTAAAHIATAIVRLAHRMLQDPDTPFGTFHFAGAPPVSWYGFAREIFAQAEKRGWAVPKAGRPVTSAAYGSPAPRPENSVLDCTQLLKAYGIEPPAWAEGLNTCLEELTQERES